MNMLQRIVNAFGSRQQAEREARAEAPLFPEFHRTAPGTPGGSDPGPGPSDDAFPREAAQDPSVAARRLWCSAGHF